MPGRLAWLLVMVILSLGLATCQDRESRNGATVSGKVVYRGMGLEEVPIAVLIREGGRWARAEEGRSGYHGTFHLHLPPGEYALAVEVGGTVVGRPDLRLRGRVEGLEIGAGGQRLDRVVIELRPEP